MSSRSGSRVRRSRTVDNANNNSSHGSVPGHDPHISSQGLLPTTRGNCSSVPSGSSTSRDVHTVASAWGRGTGRRGPTRCATERRLEPGQRLKVTVVGGCGIGEQGTYFVTRMGVVLRMHCKLWQRNLSTLTEETKNAIFRDLEGVFEWDRTPQSDKEMLQHMTAMLKGWRGMLKNRYYKGKTFENAIASVPSGVDPSDWQTMCEKWSTREEKDIAERNSHNRSHQTMTYRRGRTSIYQLKDDFVKTHQRDPNRIEIFKMGRCRNLPDGTEQWVDGESSSHYEKMTQMMTPDLESDAHTTPEDAFIAVMGRDRPGRVRCAGRAETRGSWYGTGEGSSSGGNHPQVQQLQHQLQEQAKRMEEMTAERSRDRQEMEAMRKQVEQMQVFMQQLASQQTPHVPVSAHEGTDDSGENYDDDDEDDDDGGDE